MKRKSEKTDKEIVLLSDQSTDIQSNKKERPKDGLFLLSRLHLYRKSPLMMTQQLLRVLLLVSYIATIDSNQFWTSNISLVTRSINDTPIYFQQQ